MADKPTYEELEQRTLELERAVKALQKKESMLDSLHRNAPVGMALLDPERQFYWPNPALAKITGYSLEELREIPTRKLYISEDEYLRVAEVIRENLSQTGFISLGTRWLRRDGRIANIILSATYRNPDNQSDGIIGTALDVTESKRVDEAFRESEEKYRLLFENAVVGIFQSTPDGCFLGVNPAFARILGYDSPADLITSISDIAQQYYAHPDDRNRYKKLLQETGRVEDFAFQAQRKDGSVIWVSNSTYAYFSEEGEVIRYEGILLDVNERKMAEVALQESEARYRLMFNSANDPIFIHQPHGDGKPRNFLEVNEIACKVYGYTREELLGMTPADLMVPEKQVDTTTHINKIFGEGKAVFEVTHKTREGKFLHVEISAYLTDLGGKRTILSIVRDIGERKRVEEELRQSEKKFRNLVEGSIQGVLVHRDHKPLFVNQAWASMHGYTTAEILTIDSVLSLMAPNEKSRLAEYNKIRAQGGDVPRRYEYQGIRKDKTLIWLENRVMVVQWDGKPAIQSIIVDISDRKQIEAEKDELIVHFQKALADVKVLSGLLPICSYCKKIRDDKGYWKQIESFIQEHSQAMFSHSICKECADKHYPEYGLYDD